MTNQRKKRRTSSHYEHAEQTGCMKEATENYTFFANEIDNHPNFPVFWSLLGESEKKRNYFSICRFFCQMQAISREDGTQRIIDHLQRRLFSRFPDWQGGEVALPRELTDLTKRLSVKQLLSFQDLEDKRLLDSAFELFAAGALTTHRTQVYEKPIPTISANRVSPVGFSIFEPDGGAFFFWAEFAFTAAYAGIDAEHWKRIIPTLLRSQRIYAMCYGGPKAGVIPACREFGDYSKGEIEFQSTTLADTAVFELKEFKSFEDLEEEATNCAKFAFPGEFNLCLQ